MTAEQGDSVERERRRNEILAACLEDPQLAAEVATFLADHVQMERLAAPLRPLPIGADQPCPSAAPTVTEPNPALSKADSIPATKRFGNYELLDEIARGGMGIVYKARQQGLNRNVALKMILTGRLAGEQDVQRFRTEAEAAARLRHPNIVRVHEVGAVDGQHFFSMEFIEGCTLAQRMMGGPIAGRVAAGYVLQVARAIHYAHLQGILHRDLKPSNILLDKDDVPHVTDFGLAKRLSSSEGGGMPTRTGAVLGTPSYMA